MNHILPEVEELISTLKQLMPTLYQQETLESIFGLFLEGQVKLPHHCTTKSESAIRDKAFNHQMGQAKMAD